MLGLFTLVLESFINSSFFLAYFFPFIGIMSLIGVVTVIYNIIRVR